MREGTSPARPRRRTWGFPALALSYLGRSFVSAFALSFLFFFIVFFVNQILLLAEDILSKNAPPGQTMLLLVYSLPSVVAIAFPFSSLAGALMTSAGLNADREILAFSACGISPRTLYLPFVLIGAFASFLSFAANDYFLPRSSKAFRSLYGQMVARSASIELKPYSVKRYPQAVVVTGEKAGDKAGQILVFEMDRPERRSLISAAAATLALDPRGEAARIEMDKVLEQSVPTKDEKNFTVTKAEHLSYRFSVDEPVVGFSGGNPSEMSSKALSGAIVRKRLTLEARKGEAEVQRSNARAGLVLLYGALDSGLVDGDKRLAKAVSDVSQSASARPMDRSLQIYELEYDKKFAIPAAGLFFALLAFPLGLGARRAGRTAGFGAALLLSTLYWGALFVGQTAGLRGLMSPWFAMWLPNLLVLAVTAVVWAARLGGSRRSV